MSQNVKSLSLGQEEAPPGEQALIDRIEESIRAKIRSKYAPGTARRDAHPKMHGLVRAKFTILDGLPKSLQFGVFQTPRTFDAWIRFSSGKPNIHPDTERDAQGMAIKLMGVEGEKLLEAEKHETTHDFVMINNPAFFIRNVADYVPFQAAVVKDKTPLIQFISLMGFFLFRGKFAEMLALQRTTGKDVANPMQIRYWSQTPYKLGPQQAIKFSARPVASSQTFKPQSPDADYMQEAMTNQLAHEEVWFDFLVQVQTDPVKMPVEDALVVWDETLSPFQKVATIQIPKQTFASPEQMAFGENLSFTPWHALPEHQPLGGINRCRRTIYQAISTLRHEMNNAPRHEPTGKETFPA